MSLRPRIVITGAGGQVGRELVRSFADSADVFAFDHAALDLASPEQIRTRVRETEPHVIINAGAYTAVDRAESERDLAMAINALAPGILAEEASRVNAILVHYSTDYVFDGLKVVPWIETDPTNPLNIYGATKLAGEDAIREAGGRYLIFRTSWVYGPQGKNFLLTMLRLGRERDTLNVVDDQIGAPTTSIELARATNAIVTGILADRFGQESRWAGVYHMTCSGSVSWCGFAKAIFARALKMLSGKVPKVNAITTAEFPTPATRPRNSVLSNDKLHDGFGVKLASWESALDEVLKALPSQ